MAGDILDKAKYQQPLLQGLLDAWDRNGNKVIAADNPKSGMNYRQLFTRAFILADVLRPLLAGEEYVAVMLPNTLAVLVTFTSLQCLGKIPSMLNFSAGEANISHACRITNVKTILTSRQFIEQAKLDALAASLGKNYALIYLEDLRAKIGLGKKLCGAARAFFPKRVLRDRLAKTKADAPAVVLYTSGSEGTPKGVALSHANILVNIAQVLGRITFKPDDVVFNALPVFHSFGLTVGMLMPVMVGLKTYLYPSPLHYKLIPPLVKKSGATIMLGADTFYRGYAMYGTKEEFANVWLAVAGAEKLKDATHARCKEKLGIDIMQGYGVTEASPVVACNTPRAHKMGTVGKAFPAIDTRLEPVPGLPKGGRLFIRGPNIMLGYFKAGQPGLVQPQGEWYDTGDIVYIDAEGFISILGRAKRFAKIGGEMVSLTAVEEAVFSLNTEVAHAALAVPDERKGEQVVLYSEDKTITRDALIPLFKEKGLSEISLPRAVVFIEALPRLASGKIDYMALTAEATQKHNPS